MTDVTEEPVGEYERERVPDRALQGAGSFWGMYAGEHTAGTEFMLGPLFVAWGANAFDLIVGLLIGNLLAVLTWRYLTAPIATSQRLTLYYQLEKICGRDLVTLYNFANGLLFCFLAGAMVTVSATAVGVPFGDAVQMPTFRDRMPTGVSWVLICLAIGAVMTLVAAKGYAVVAKVSQVAAPWMFLMFVACGVTVLARLDTLDIMALLKTTEGSEAKISFWGIVCFAWFCNAAMHLGMADLSVLRFARKPSYGWASSAGMFLGHYIAWICAALLLVYWVREHGVDPTEGKPPGEMVFDAVGWSGVLCVIIAGWTTANPTIYRAGLAFQGMFPAMSRVAGTVLAGAVCTIASVFPAFAMQLLDFVGIYGTILAPVGAVIAVDHYLAPKLGFLPSYATQSGVRINLAVLVAWLLPVGVAMWLFAYHGAPAYYLPLPSWIACGVIYAVLSMLMHRPSVVPQATS